MGDRLTVYYDGSCPICSREIGFYRARAGADGFDWVNVAGGGWEVLGRGLSHDAALARMHVRRADGTLLKNRPMPAGEASLAAGSNSATRSRPPPSGNSLRKRRCGGRLRAITSGSLSTSAKLMVRAGSSFCLARQP
jgi:hypothetical protein